MYARARERVRAILDGPVVDPVEPGVMAAVDAILARADAELLEA
jgi:hypothetical protein